MWRRVFFAISVSAIIILPVVFLFISYAQEETDRNFSLGKKSSIPEWVKRTNFAIEVGSDIKPKYYFETIQPLWTSRDEDWVFFNQSRIAERSARPIYNVGFGLRKAVGEDYLFGVNTFYDYQDLHKHSRGGIGFEALTYEGLEARVNTYLRISKKHLVGEDSATEYYEEVANGLDYEAGTPLPFMNFLKVYGGGYWYNFEHFKNKYGWKFRTEYNPLPYSRLNFEIFDDTKRDSVGYKLEGAITLALTSFSWDDIRDDLKFSRRAISKIDVRKKMLNRVVRDFDITVIKSSKSKATGLVVEGGKT
jgi:hypothetical protein